MILKVGHVDLSRAELTPADDLRVDNTFLPFRTKGVPWCSFAAREMVILVYNTYEVHLYSPQDPQTRFAFECKPIEYFHLVQLYRKGKESAEI